MKLSESVNKVIAYSLRGVLPVMIFALSITLGAIALFFTPREEEPQIVVPVVDVLVEAPGLSARQVERQVAIPLEKLLAQIPGVEHVYSTSLTGKATVTLRFYVGENREEAILNTYNKLYSSQNKIPAVVANWLVHPVEVDDVPIVLLALWSDKPQRNSDAGLRRIADELSTYLQAIDNTGAVNVTGGRPRTIHIQVQPESLAARQSTSADIINALQLSNVLQQAGYWTLNEESIMLESGDFIRSVDQLRQTVINVIDGQPVFLQDVADIVDGPAEPVSYHWINFSEQHEAFQPGKHNHPMVTISIAKKRGSNAVRVAEDVHALLSELKQTWLSDDIHIDVLRDYGVTANEKVDGLASSLVFAIVTVVIFIAVFLGWRQALVVGLAVPVSYGITLALDMAFGYTINRVTLFALIVSLGLLVDDPITGVDNIDRFFKKTGGSLREKIVAAMAEIKTPLIMSTLTIILAFIPLAFITGMMGPYMAPMAFNVPVSVITSTVVAFMVTPWLASQLLHRKVAANPATQKTTVTAVLSDGYRSLMQPLLDDRRKATWVLWIVLALFVIAAALPLFRLVPLKLLPFDNKNELQVLIDMPESATLEQTAAMAQRVSQMTLRLNEVRSVAAFVGEPSPMDFNGMVRRYYQRVAPHLADLRVTLIDKTQRQHQSHSVVLRLRQLLAPLADGDISIKVVEVPPGPPVLSTLVAEIYGSPLTPYTRLQQAAQQVKSRLEREAFVVEVDTSVEGDQRRLRFITDKQKATLSAIATDDINKTLLMANSGVLAGFMQLEREASPLPVRVRLPLQERSSLHDLQRLQVKGRPGFVKTSDSNGLDVAPQPLVALGELGQFRYLRADKSIHRKDLNPVVYVTAELSGRTPAEVIADVLADLNKPGEVFTAVPTERNETESVIAGVAERDKTTGVAERNKAERVIADIAERNKSEKVIVSTLVNRDQSENVIAGISAGEQTSKNNTDDWKRRNFLNPGAGDRWTLPDDIHVIWTGEGEWNITVDVFRDMGLAFMFALLGIFFVLKIQTASSRLALIIMSAIPLTIIGIMPGFWWLNQLGEREVAGAPEPVLFTATAMIGMIALAGIVVRNSLVLVEFIGQARSNGLAIKEALIQAGAVRMRPILLTAGTTLLGNLIITLDPVFSGLALAIIFGLIASTLFTLLVVPIVYLFAFENQSGHIRSGVGD